MTASRLTLVLDAHDPARQTAFWAGLLGRATSGVGDDAWLPGTDTQVGLRFVPSRAPRTGPNRVHLHVTTSGPTGQQDTVAAARRAGASHRDVGQRPEEDHVVLVDPGGDEFCVIEPDNRYLAGCGPLGELACDGTRTVGMFWAAALAWPLVWDQDEETAVQSPLGGTKVAWGGPPVAPQHGPPRQRFEITVGERALTDEVARLTGLGASPTGRGGADRARLTDPDGVAFELVAG